MLDPAGALKRKVDGRNRRAGGAAQRDRRNPVVAVDSKHVLDEVGRLHDIASPRRGLDHQLARAHLVEPVAQRLQDLPRLEFLHLDSTHARDHRGVEGDLSAPLGNLAGNQKFAGFAAAQLEDQPGSDFGSRDGKGRIDAALEAVAGVGFDTQSAPRARRARGIEQGDFEQHVRRALGTACRFTAHHAGDREQARLVADAGHLVVEGVVLAVERANGLTAASRAHPQIPFDATGVENMGGAAETDGEVVRDIDQRGDRPQAHRKQPLLQPGRARPVGHAAHQAPHEQRTGVGMLGRKLELDRNLALDRAGHGSAVEILEAAQTGRGEVAGNAVHAQAVGPVRSDLDLDHRVVQPQHTGKRRAKRRVVGQFDDAVVIVREPHFAFRAQHAVAFDAADLAPLELDPGARDHRARSREHALHAGPRVGRAAHHLQGLRARIDGADAKLVGVGMGLGGDYRGDRKRRQNRGPVDHLLDLEAERRQTLGDLVDGRVGLQMLLEPGQRELHRASPPARLGTSKAENP